nr:glycosyltransferase family 39 protein [Chloroflexota bacterium]
MELNKEQKDCKRNKTSTANKLFRAFIVIALILCVFALYARTLSKQSLWFDEGLSVFFAAKPVPQLIHTLIYEDLHPPLYYLLLHAWMKLAGKSEFAVRMPSMLAAVLLIPLAFAVVQEIQGRENKTIAWTIAGAFAAAIVGFSPFIAFYAQETRMYSLAATLALATTWAFLRATRAASTRWWLTFACLLGASFYTQYFSVFTVSSFILYALFLERKALQQTGLCTLLAGLLYLPWLRPAYLQMGRLLLSPDYWVTTRIRPMQFLQGAWSMFLPCVSLRWGLLIAILGIIFLARLVRRSGFHLSETVRRSTLVFLTFLIPLLLTYAAVAIVPKFATRYAIVAAAPLYICSALVLHVLLVQKSPLARALFAVLALATIILSLRSAIAVTEARENPRDDVRGLAAYLTEHAQPNDALLLVEYAPYALQYYYRGTAPWYGLHVGQDFAGAAEVLNRILQTRPRRIWLILWHHEFADPTDMVVTELLRVGREVSVGKQFFGYWLRAFDILDYDQPIVAYPQPQIHTDAGFAPGLACLGFDRFKRDGGRLHYVIYWQATQPLERNYSVTLSFQDQDGTEYLRRDQALSTPYFLPPVWPLHTPIRGRIDVTLLNDLPPLTYRVYLKVLDPESKRNLDLVDANGTPLGQSLFLEEFALSKADVTPSPAEVRNPLQADLGDNLQLLGFDPPRITYSHGDTLSLTLWWQCTDTPRADHTAVFRLLDSRGRVAWEMEKPIVPGHLTTHWRPGEVNRAIYHLGIPSDLSGGEYSLQVGTEERLIALTALHIAPREHRYNMPTMQQTLNAQFEQGITLLGYDLQAPAVQPGRTITVTLYWQATQPITTSYKVSVQMLSADLRLTAQDDSIPARWSYPTTAWLPGEIIADEHALTIAPAASPGHYTLITVLYDERGAQRLSVQQSGQTRDHAILTTLQSSP